MANNTALRAGKDTTRTITFKNKEHEKFYYTYLPKCRYQDVYHKALVYCLGIDRDTRENAEQIYDFKTGYVKTASATGMGSSFSPVSSYISRIAPSW